MEGFSNLTRLVFPTSAPFNKLHGKRLRKFTV